MKKLLFFLLVCSISLLPVIGASVFAEDDMLIGTGNSDTTNDGENGGDIVYTKPLKAVLFSHNAHVLKLGLQCEWCHDETFQMEAGAMENQDDEEIMASLCNERYCGTCHNDDVAFSTTTQCARCHIGVKGYNQMVREGKIAPVEKSQENPLDSLTKQEGGGNPPSPAKEE